VLVLAFPLSSDLLVLSPVVALWARAVVELVGDGVVPAELWALWWLLWASAVVELVSDGVVPAEICAVSWLLWASARVSLVSGGVIPALIGTLWEVLSAWLHLEELVAVHGAIADTWAAHSCFELDIASIVVVLGDHLVETISGGVEGALLLFCTVETIVIDNKLVVNPEEGTIVGTGTESPCTSGQLNVTFPDTHDLLGAASHSLETTIEVDAGVGNLVRSTRVGTTFTWHAGEGL
jgi:hypothetical protein